MTEDRLAQLYETIAAHDGSSDPFQRLQAMCQAATRVLPVSGAGVMLMAQRTHQGTIYATDATIQRLEELQNAAAEGPCIDAYRLGRPVLEPDLAISGRRAWPHLAPSALQADMAALFSFPLQLDDASIGALNLYRDQPGGLTEDQSADARLLAAMIAREVLALQAVGDPESLPAQIADLSGDRTVIEQATGMVSAQLNIPMGQAAHQLRTYAHSHDRALAEVAHAIVDRTLRLG